MATFTCLTCQVAFYKFELQREHYKSDWHRYNLKRKVAELPPVTAENFQQRVLTQRSHRQTEDKDSDRHCQVCRKHFNTGNAYSNHLNSRKHVEAVEKSASVPSSVIDKNIKNVGIVGPTHVGADDRHHKDVQNLVKKFQLKKSENAPKTLMTNEHLSRINNGIETDEDESDEEEENQEWEDVEGEALGLEECLFCSQASSDMTENIKHMTDTHSFFIPDVDYLVNLEGLLSYLGEKVGVGYVCLWCNEKGKSFYSVKSVQQHMIDKGHCKLLHEGSALEEYTDFYDYSTSYPDHGDNAVAVDQEIDGNVIDGEGFQMVLPSGATVGHRSLMKYYRQNLVPQRAQPNRRLLHNVMSHYRALGWTGLTGEGAARKARDISLMHFRRSKLELKQGMINNKLQRHYRPQILM